MDSFTVKSHYIKMEIKDAIEWYMSSKPKYTQKK